MTVLLSVASASNDEVLKYGSDEQVRERFEQLCAEVEVHWEARWAKARDGELKDEQIWFAQCLITDIQRVCKELGTAEEIKTAVAQLIADCPFDR